VASKEEVTAKRQELGYGPNEIFVGNVARLVPVKDHQCLLRAMNLVTSVLPHARLIIVGDGPERSRLKRLAVDLSLGERVQFLGERRDVWDLMGIFDLFVLSSLSEGVSMTLLEAMVAAKPVVATHVGGNIELINNGCNGLLVPTDDPEALTAAILRLLQDRRLAQRMGQVARQEVER
ncbi:glycosyltransferase, partial [bacterium]|nr:glycosyltransferase [bacterium]